jgi:phosphoribosyl 1,2-cyclic phosphodiesterase
VGRPTGEIGGAAPWSGEDMRIRCWGARGSLPVSGKEYLKYGGDTACIEIRTKNDAVIIIDAGTGIRRLGKRLLSDGRREYSLLMTHVHWDHIIGFPFFTPVYRVGTRIDVYGCPCAEGSVEQMLSHSMDPPYFPVRFDKTQATFSFHRICGAPFSIDSVSVSSIALSHPNMGVGYRFVEDGRSFVFLTDNELTFKHPGGLDFGDYRNFSAGADLLIHDAEFKPEEYARTKGLGHSVYVDALQLAVDARVKRFGLFHHNFDRTDEEVDEIVDRCRALAREKKAELLECFAVTQEFEVEL